MKKYTFRIIAMVLFLIGVIPGMLIFGGASWADLESVFYGFQDMGGGRLNTLDCPILMTSSDVGTVEATFKNPNDTPISFMVQADISNSGMFRTERSTVNLEGKKSKTISWKVTSQDVDLRNFIFVQISNFPAQKIPFRQATCGIMVLNFPQFSGNQVFPFAMIVILGGIVGGLWIWELYGQPVSGKLPEMTRAMKTLGILVLVGMLVSFWGSWLFGVIIFAASVLAIGVILGFLLA